MSNHVVQGLWIGPELSVMERLSAASFMAHGHEYHLYVYDDVRGVPAGVRVRDADEILPASMIFQYSHSKSYAGFANHFRYQLLFDRGGWWADTDVICVKPFSFDDEHVISTEEHKGAPFANNGVMKAPAGSPLMDYLCGVCRAKDPEQLVWGETGPKLLDEALRQFGLEHYLKPPRVFCPLGYLEWEKALDADAPPALDEETHAVHLWNEMWRRAERDKNARHAHGCLYERLKRKYLGSVDEAVVP
ncbi:MAG TPA: glycosyltransferase [Pyrinomonadaceae bacterium]